MTTVPLAVVPELRKRGLLTSAELWPFLRRMAIAMSGVAVAIGCVAFFIPDSLGQAFLGDSWPVVRPLLPVTATEYAALAWFSAAAGGLIAQARSGALLQIRLQFSLVTLVAGVAAAAIWGQALGVAMGLALAAIVAAVVGRAMFLHPPPPKSQVLAQRGKEAE
jgi:hypothetical protein